MKILGLPVGAVIAIVVAVIVLVVLLMSGYVKAPTDKAYIISGIKKKPRVLIGRAGVKIPFFERKDELILKQISIDIKTNGYIPTRDFIGVDIDAVAKIRVLTYKDVSPEKGVTEEMAVAAMVFKIYEKEHGEPYSGDWVEYGDYLEAKQNEAIRRLSVVWDASKAKKELE